MEDGKQITFWLEVRDKLEKRRFLYSGKRGRWSIVSKLEQQRYKRKLRRARLSFDSFAEEHDLQLRLSLRLRMEALKHGLTDES